MVTSHELFGETCGNVFLIPYENEKFILSQVGFGDDLGVFDRLVTSRDNILSGDPNLLFRIHYGRISPKKWKWISLGMFPYKATLSISCPYLYRPVGSDECFLVRFGQEDEIVDCDKGEEYEPLATWSHEHIINRFRKSRSQL